ncbi:MAG: SCP2 sterol-binding domain-containing protein [Pseudomonadales bacterium]|jgi:ubiquinone biosynthesis protein UbiJ|nr:SCP2 sterol-binding domain-containing protein [Pseudomonadales bacterium]
MSFSLLQSALLLPVETALNALLALDPLSAQRLHPFEGRTLAIRCTNPTLQLYIGVRAGKLSLSPVHGGAMADATLTGSARALGKLLAKGGLTHSLYGTGVGLEGSTALVSGLRDALMQLDCDWEYQISRLTGDLPAAALGKLTRAGSAALARSRERLHEDLGDYFTQESRLTPHPREVNAFYTALREFDLRLDRAQAKLTLSEASIS